MNRVQNLQKIVDAGIIAVVRADTPEKAEALSKAAIKGGVMGIELTFTVPHADQVIAKLTEELPDGVIGAGTVLDVTSARLAMMAGAGYIVSPTYDPDIAKLCNLYQVPYLPGCSSMTEMRRALENGSDIIKLFPASVAGPSMIKAVKAPFPQINVMPTGGVDLDNLDQWFAAGAVCVGAGGNLVGPGETGDYDQVTENAKAYIKKLNEIRNK
ncbi:bifunctional 2-keto-4-hydroxyglutarate aldolase/2-keto-3-deoxy-6-phosphogluconate aldolase [Lentilactobacillus parakefiri]|uniref:Bifunctional 2-keto-4-hydroxyglutarate aldolase/2-keto-3-deoxy-6-phosphogluconate aldolase n=1 Tax=Lentilactobacillus parakefiri TaxID=152332 RepID=A0A269YPW9_9LACO|nr:bifunctional 2-keto-4-hydroxyglutarate aldolase/2-keto-3-deoxy-6-phosphogluconate aldolase [Lentilactobacillus parakefiri]PAK87578.1 bifunctional 2-keto-4-hydroxyglutarate aldolase/2-keto-3-deoxy-6-phosphogluconate aldolase [Lentilactobacillus parakefiri]